MHAGDFAALALALYIGHHGGDYWAQRDEDAKHKGDAGADGHLHCLLHVISYMITQWLCLGVVWVTFGLPLSFGAAFAGMLVSGTFHYAIDRREHGIMFWLARRLPGKANFLKLGVPRAGMDDNPTLGTGAWALDQSAHLLTSVFLAALVMAWLS